MGSPLEVVARELEGTRKWRIKDFDRFLIFYTPLEDGVRVLRVLHTSQDWWSLLGLAD
jgi:toxin ParE1/3/4